MKDDLAVRFANYRHGFMDGFAAAREVLEGPDSDERAHEAIARFEAKMDRYMECIVQDLARLLAGEPAGVDAPMTCELSELDLYGLVEASESFAEDDQ